MTFFLLVVIALLLFIISKFLHSSADRIETPTPVVSQNPKPLPQAIRVSHWQYYQKTSPTHAAELLKVTNGKIATLSDFDVKETIASFDHTAKTNSLQSYEAAYQLVLNKMVEYLDESYPNVILEAITSVIQEESKQSGRKQQNTVASYVKAELEQIIENKLKAMPPVELFKYRIKEALQHISEKYEWNIEREGYDSPLAQEAVKFMRSAMDNTSLMEAAFRYGYADSFRDIIYDEVELFISEKCNTTLDNAADYCDNKAEYQNPFKRCPACGSKNIHILDHEEGEYYCADCKYDWHPRRM